MSPIDIQEFFKSQMNIKIYSCTLIQINEKALKKIYPL